VAPRGAWRHGSWGHHGGRGCRAIREGRPRRSGVVAPARPGSRRGRHCCQQRRCLPNGPSALSGRGRIDAALATNIRAPYFLTAALAPAMIARGSGSIVNITTMAAHVGMPGMSAYGATKAALSSLTRTWAAEFHHRRGRRTNSYLTGHVTKVPVDSFQRIPPPRPAPARTERNFDVPSHYRGQDRNEL
jgi:NAD(P)-dependent dehydrogenase (short-subunit alcohol dehydrogenase family)